jgi:hypothetical protein
VSPATAKRVAAGTDSALRYQRPEGRADGGPEVGLCPTYGLSWKKEDETVKISTPTQARKGKLLKQLIFPDARPYTGLELALHFGQNRSPAATEGLPLRCVIGCVGWKRSACFPKHPDTKIRKAQLAVKVVKAREMRQINDT